MGPWSPDFQSRPNTSHYTTQGMSLVSDAAVTSGWGCPCRPHWICKHWYILLYPTKSWDSTQLALQTGRVSRPSTFLDCHFCADVLEWYSKVADLISYFLLLHPHLGRGDIFLGNLVLLTKCKYGSLYLHLRNFPIKYVFPLINLALLFLLRSESQCDYLKDKVCSSTTYSLFH